MAFWSFSPLLPAAASALPPIVGTLAQTQAGDSVSAEASGPIAEIYWAELATPEVLTTQGILEATQASDTVSSTATAASTIYGTLEKTQDSDSVTGEADAIATGTASKAQADDSVTGEVDVIIAATASKTQDNDTLAAETSGAPLAEIYWAVLAVPESTATGITATFNVAQASNTTITDVDLTVKGVLNTAQAGDTVFAGVSDPIAYVYWAQFAVPGEPSEVPVISAGLNQQQAAQSSNGVGIVSLDSELIQAQASDTLYSDAAHEIIAEVTWISFDLNDYIDCNVAAQAGSDTLSALCQLSGTATLSVNQDNNTLVSDTKVLADVLGSLVAQQGSDGADSVGSVSVPAELDASEGDDTLQAATVAGTVAALDAEQGSDTVAGIARATVDADFTVTAAADSAGGLGTSSVTGVLNAFENNSILLSYVGLGPAPLFASLNTVQENQTTGAEADVAVAVDFYNDQASNTLFSVTKVDADVVGITQVAQDSNTIVAESDALVRGTTTVTTANDSANALGSVLASGTVVYQQTNNTLNATGIVLPVRQASVIVTQASDTLLGTAKILGIIAGQLLQTQQNNTIASNAIVSSTVAVDVAQDCCMRHRLIMH